MKVLTVAALVSLAPTLVVGLGCNADNVLRALRANSAKASPFCSTYTRPPPNQPLPTYVSQYAASKVTSACSCLITTSSTRSSTSSTSSPTISTRWWTSSKRSSTSTTSSSTSSTTTPSSTPTPTPYYCETDALTNGDFNLQANGKADPWVAAPPSNANGQSTSASFGNSYALVLIPSPPLHFLYPGPALTLPFPSAFSASTTAKQAAPAVLTSSKQFQPSAMVWSST